MKDLTAQIKSGQCQNCGYIGSITDHHIIHQRLKIGCPLHKPKIKYECMNKFDKPVIKEKELEVPLVDVKIQLCIPCHNHLHPENKLMQEVRTKDIKIAKMRKQLTALEKKIKNYKSKGSV